MLRVQRLEEKELAYLTLVLGWSFDEFLAAVVVEEMLGGPAVSAETHEPLYLEFKEAIQLLREGKL